MEKRDALLTRLSELGFDTAQCDDMTDERLAGWLRECEMIAARREHGHLPPDGAPDDDRFFDPDRMADAFDAAARLQSAFGEKAMAILLQRIAEIAPTSDMTRLKRYGDIVQALRDMETAKKIRH